MKQRPDSSTNLAARRRLEKLALCGLWLPSLCASATGATATWNGNAAIGVAGDGVSWSNSNNWSSGGAVDTAPSNTAPGDDLTFGNGTVGILLLGGNRFANSLTFNAGFSLDSAGSTNTLTLATGNVTLSSASAAIGANLAGTSGLNLSGIGTLTLQGSNAYAGGTNVNGGTLTIAGASALGAGVSTVSPGAVLNLSANIATSGSFSNSGTLNVSGGATVIYTNSTSSPTFTQSAGTLNVNGTLILAGGTFNDNGGTINGTVEMQQPTTGFGNFLSFGAGASSGTILLDAGNFPNAGTGVNSSSFPAGVTVIVQADATTANEIQLPTVFTNNGTIVMTSVNGSNAVQLFDPGGPTQVLTNNGTITINKGAGGFRYIGDVLANSTSGLVSVNTDTFFGYNVTNSGTINLAPGTTTLNGDQNSLVPTFTQTAGTLTIGGAFIFSGSTFMDNGGTISGTVELQPPEMGSNSLSFGAGATTGTFLFDSRTDQFPNIPSISSSSIPAGISVVVQASQSISPAAYGLQLPTTFTNNGSLTLQAINGNNAVSLTTTGSSPLLTNNGTLTTSPNPTADGGRSIVDNLANAASGVFAVNASTLVQGNLSNAGTINIAAGKTLTVGSLVGSPVTYSQSSGTLSVSGTFSPQFATISGGTTTINPGGAIQITNNALTLSAATITLAADATHPGQLRVGVGGLNVSSATAYLATAAVGVGQIPGVIDFGGANRTIDVLDQSGGDDLVVTAELKSGGFIKAGPGLMNLQDTGLYPVNTEVQAGTLELSTTNALNPAGHITVDSGGGLMASAPSQTVTSAAIAGTAEVVPGATLIVGTGGALTFDGSAADSTRLTLDASLGTPGQLLLDGEVVVTGSDVATIVNGGSPVLKNRGRIDLDGGIRIFDVESVNVAGGPGLNIAVPLVNGGIIKTGPGTLTLNSTKNSFARGITINGGYLQITAGSSFAGTITATVANGSTGFVEVDTDAELGLAANALVLAGGGLEATSTFSTSRSITIGDPVSGGLGLISVSAGDTLTLNSSPVGLGGLVQVGAGTLVLTGSSTYSGSTTVAAGTLLLANGAQLPEFSPVSVANGATLDLSGGGQKILAALIDGTGASGTVIIGSAGAEIGTLGATRTFSGTITGAGQLSMIAAINPPGAPAGTPAPAPGTLTLSGPLNTSGGVNVAAGTLVLQAANAFTGGVAIAGGTLSVFSDTNLGNAANGISLSNGGTLSAAGSFSSTRAVSIGSGGGTINVGQGTFAPFQVTFSGSLTGPGALTKSGPGTLFINTSASLTGPVAVDGGISTGTSSNGGELVLTSNGALPGITSLRITNQGVVDLQDSNGGGGNRIPTNVPITLAGGVLMETGSSISATFENLGAVTVSPGSSAIEFTGFSGVSEVMMLIALNKGGLGAYLNVTGTSLGSGEYLYISAETAGALPAWIQVNGGFANYNQTYGVVPRGFVAPGIVQNGISAVPEPGGLAMLAFAGLGLLRRRSRRCRTSLAISAVETEKLE